MIWSKYNYLFKSEKFGYLLYNSISNCFAEVCDEAYLRLIELKSNSNIIIDKNDEFLSQLIDAKIIVSKNADDDEINNIKLEVLLSRFKSPILNLIIAPTMDCNFNCQYCFEESRPSIYMNDETENNLIEFIKSYQDIGGLNITWFGGEPLLSLERMISINKKIKDLKINYNSSIITNGYLLESLLDHIDSLKIDTIQITIDGIKETHNKRRPHLTNNDSFEKITENIEKLYKQNYEGTLLIRVNVDKSNDKEFIIVYNELNRKFGDKKIKVYPGYVIDAQSCKSLSGCNFDRFTKADFMIDQFNSYKIDLGFYPNHSLSECMARNINSFLIGPSGDMYKCFNDIGVSEKTIGNINKKGSVESKVLTRYMVGADVFNDPTCIKCFHLPICGGGCVSERIKTKYKKTPNNYCDVKKGNLNKFLEIYYQLKQDQL